MIVDLPQLGQKVIEDDKETLEYHQFNEDLTDHVNRPRLPEYTVSSLPEAQAGFLIYVSDETSGGTIAFGDGTNWRRVQDRAIVS